MLEFNNVTVAGSGVLGLQIAYQTALFGKNVVVYNPRESSIEKAKIRMEKLITEYQRDLNLSDQQVKESKDRLTYNHNLAEAVAQADLVIEALPELVETKNTFYTDLAKVVPEKTIIVTNTSSLLPSQFADVTGRPEKFLALHFANQIRSSNTAEIMKHDRTSENAFNAVINFAKEIGMVPLPIHKEQPGYILNSILMPFLASAEFLVVNGVADPHTIDKTWMIATQAPMGPFAILDIVGIKTAYNISLSRSDEASQKLSHYLDEEFIQKNKLGIETGEGFYTYPNPAYQDKDFLK